MAAPDAWTETCLIAITKEGSSSDVAFASLTETIDIDTGEKDMEGIANLAGGRIVKFSPEGDTTITFEAYTTEVGTDTGTTGKGFFDLMFDDTDAVQPLSIPATAAGARARDRYRVAILWTDNTSETDATAAVVTAYYAKRFYAKNGYFTSVKPSFTDGILKISATFKVVPFDKAGTSRNITIESVDATAQLAALGTY